MGSIDNTMIHSCKIVKDQGTTQDDAGEPIKNLVSTDSKCFFSKVSSAGNYLSNGDSGWVKVTSIMCFLPDSAIVEKGDIITTTETHFAGTYTVEDVDAPQLPFTDFVDHLEASLKEVAKRE